MAMAPISAALMVKTSSFLKMASKCLKPQKMRVKYGMARLGVLPRQSAALC
ncbi:hypothetical protein X747_20765 [Mesorhizobium sp. LNJC384A00]|nr:hypothetical protein X763_22880 [Mesorhizobium sp. LSHC432A00]ESY29433.1 hypothetical protein X749_15925 [Mesorhizobium sp. LNJC391B00]ESY40499.1 hypothetical protein X747_20765 [Mesorhizobium sp. LNJC384A00]